MAPRLAREQGIFVGTLGGTTLAAAFKAAERPEPGSVLLAMPPDTGECYPGIYFFDDLNARSDDEWLASLDKH
jgi:cysteine synthase A